jgi:oxygen-dependent protoporphyrinogen oxidase
LDTSLIVSTLTPRTLDTIIPQDCRLPHLSYNPATSVGVVNFVFPAPADTIHPAGFGYLVPRSASSVLFPIENATEQPPSPNPDGIIGVIFDSTSMTGVEDSPLVASHFTKLTVMMGGPHWSTYPSEPTMPSSPPIPIPSPEQLPSKALAHLKKVFPHIPDPVLSEGFIQKECIPTYLIGHGQRLRQLHETMEQSAWAGKLVLIGSGYGGVGVNDCVGMAEQTVLKLAASWSTSEPQVRNHVTGLERWKHWE